MKNSMKKAGFVLVICITIIFSGCAGYNITKDGKGDGYDVYKPEPYLLVTQQGLNAKIVWLPNYQERYRIDTWNIMGKADFEFDITDGWKLTKISDKGDNTTLSSKLLDFLQNSTKAGTISLTGEFTLYRLLYKNGVVYKMQRISVKEVKEEN